MMRTRRGRGKQESGLAVAWHGAFSALRKRDRGRPDLCDPYAEMLEGGQEACRRNGFGLEVFPVMQESANVPRVMKARAIRGLVLGPIGPNAERGLDISQLKDVHLVRVERDLREMKYDRVVSNAFEEMRMCLGSLRRAGCRRIAYIDNRAHQDSSEDRWKGAYLSIELEDATLCSPCLGGYPRSRARKALDAYIKECEPDGIVVGSRMFIDAMIDRHKAGNRMPFVCLERNAWPDWVSGVETNFRQIGAEAVQLLINRILSPHAPDQAHRTIAVHSTWHEGRSHLPVRPL